MSDAYDQLFDTLMGRPGPPTRILMVAGGTGGHIFPALAVAGELRARSDLGAFPCSIEFVGTRRPLEAKLVPAAGYRLHTVDAAGLKGIGGFQWLRNLLVLPRTMIEVGRILRAFKPQVVVGVGGYLAGPVMLLAAMRRIPTLLIEPNVRPGFTNRVLAPVVSAAAVGFEATARFYSRKAEVTGHPVRSEFMAIHSRRDMRAQTGAVALPFTILVVGGSQGSRAINRAVAASMPLLADVAPTLRSALGGHAAPRMVGPSGTGPGPDALRPCTPPNALRPDDAGPPISSGQVPPGAAVGVAASATMAGLRIIHQTGEGDYNEIRATYQQNGFPADVQAFIDDMPAALEQADLVISRAGATAVAELAAAGRASVLIPFPGATDQHQLENARAMEKVGAARVIVQPELTPERLVAEIRELAANPEMLEKMEAAARALASPKAAAQIADMAQRLAGKP